ncbi:MAG TPA: histidine phosphatase family protein [Chitinophagaceae bacterium]|nr:histidine phosphatase family protein [Chitinophagaceae bacterium]
MKQFFFYLGFAFLLASCGNTYYIVRHAEKAAQGPNMTSDVPLTEEGKARAEDLKNILKKKKIAYIYSTNTIRTKSTAQPTADYFKLPIEMYNPRPDQSFIDLLKAKTKNTLIVGHSNTVDDIVNMLCGKKKIASDLADAEYDNLFMVKRRGDRYVFTYQKFGKPAH